MMNKCGLMILCCLLGMALASTVQANLITNGDMEVIDSGTGLPASWYVGNGAISTSTDTPSGTGHSMQVYDNAGGVYYAHVYQVGIAVEPGDYELSFSYKGDSPRFWFASSAYATLGANNLDASATWTDYSTTLTVPEGVTSAMLFLYAAPAFGFVAFDNVALVPEPCTMVLMGLGGLMFIRKKFGSKA
jgi:hypothetical protein